MLLGYPYAVLRLEPCYPTTLVVAVSERLDCSADDFEGMDDRVLWFKSGIHVYDLVELAETYASTTNT